MWKPLLLILLPLLTSANIWDNLYDGQGVPFELPIDFSATITPVNPVSQEKGLKYTVYSSTGRNVISANLSAMIDTPFGSFMTVLSQFKLNFTNGSIVINSLAGGCKIFHFPDLKLNFYYTLEGMLELALLMNSQDPSDIYKKVDVSSFIKWINSSQCISDIALLFSQNDILKFMETTLANGTHVSLQFDNVTSVQAPLEEFRPKKSWKCVNMTVVEGDEEYEYQEVHGSYYDVVYNDIDSDTDEEEEEEENSSKRKHRKEDLSLLEKPFTNLLIKNLAPSVSNVGGKIAQGSDMLLDTLRQMYKAFIACNIIDDEGRLINI